MAIVKKSRPSMVVASGRCKGKETAFRPVVIMRAKQVKQCRIIALTHHVWL